MDPKQIITLLFLISATVISAHEYLRPPPRKALHFPWSRKSSSLPQQVHVSLAGDKHMRVTWVTGDKSASSVVEYGTSSGTYSSVGQGESTSYTYILYSSGKIHHTVIGPLEHDTVYFYQCGGQGPEFQFKTPPAQFPITFAVAGDLGQTGWTKSTLDHIDQCKYDVHLLPEETKTQIRVLPRDHNLPRCVSMSEEIVQVVGDPNNVKSAVAIISSRLRESQHRDRSHFQGRMHSPERFFPPDDDYIPHMNNAGRKTPMDGAPFGPRLSNPNIRNNNYAPRSSGYPIEHGSAPMTDNTQPFCEDLVFRILCPVDKVDLIVGDSTGIMELLQNEIGVDVKATNPVVGEDEQIIIISSEEGPDDELFPAQEALLHIQTRIVDLSPDKENTITTRLLVPTSDIGWLEGREGLLMDMRRLTGADIQILPIDDLPTCVSGDDVLVQIVGEIKAARHALVEVTSRIRSYLYRELFRKDTPPPAFAPGPAGSAFAIDPSPNNTFPVREAHTGNDPPMKMYQNVPTGGIAQPSKDAGGIANETVKPHESERREDAPSSLNRMPVTLVTRSILEVVIPEQAVSKLITKSRNKLAQISELSGANVTLVEDRPEETQKIIRISGTPEQAERAQSLLQGFILSTQEDGP